MKICTRCSTEKAIAEFNKKARNKDGLQNWCKDCSRSASREIYKKNPKKQIAANKVRKMANKRVNRAFLLDYKTKNPCFDCQAFYPSYVLDFDHVFGKKLLDVSKLVTYKHETMLKEIAKCQLVCSNCHRKRTFERSGKSEEDFSISAPEEEPQEEYLDEEEGYYANISI
jgi:hypothetical protein